MSELEIKIKMIELLISNDVEDFVSTYKGFEEATGATKKEIQPIVKNLVELEMIELVPAWDEDGQLMGKGYILTTKAKQWSIREWLVELKKISEEQFLNPNK